MVRRHVRWVTGAMVLAVFGMGCGGTSKPKPAAAPPPAAEAAPAAGPGPGGAQVSEPTAKDLETIINRSVPFALEQIDKHGDFYPYATVITVDDKFEPAMAKPETERPTSQEVIDMLTDALRKRAAQGQLKVVCIVVGGKMSREAGKPPVDVIQARLEHMDGTSVEVYVPWTRDPKDKKVKPGEAFAGKGVPSIFTPK